MNAQVLNDPLALFWHNEQKAITRVRRHVNLEWNKLQVDLQYTPKVLKLTLLN
jgi:hypothetical protein